MTTGLEPRQIRMLRSAINAFPAAWRFEGERQGAVEAETTNPAQSIVLRIAASAESESILITLLRAGDRAFMAEAHFPLSAWQASKEFLEGIALEAFVIGVDERDGVWAGSMILRSADLPRRRDFSYVRSWLATYDLN